MPLNIAIIKRRSFLFASFYLLLGLGLSWFGLYGNWVKTIFGFRYGMIWDPSSQYIASAIVLFENSYLPSSAHPGLPLIYLLHMVYRIFYWVSFSDASFSVFCADHFFWMVFLARMVVVLSNLLCFVLVYKCALHIWRNKNYAWVAMLAFATSFVSLFFINHVSTEPLMLIFTLLTLMCLWKYRERRLLAYLLLATFFCALGVLSKIAILTPLVVFVPIYLSLVTEDWKRFFLDSLVFVIFFAAVFLCLSWTIDWQEFFKFWFAHTPGEPTFEAGQSWYMNLLESLPKIVWGLVRSALSGLSPMNWLPLWTNEGIFNIAELMFMGVGIYGWVRYAKSKLVDKIENKALVILLLLMMPVPLFKYSFHYYYVHLAILSIFFPVGLESLLFKTRWRRFNLVTATFAVHLPALVFIAYLKVHDVRQYLAMWQPYYKAMRVIEPGERIAQLDNNTNANFITGYVINYVRMESPFIQALLSKFVATDLNRDYLTEKNVGAIIQGEGRPTLHLKKDFEKNFKLR